MFPEDNSPHKDVAETHPTPKTGDDVSYEPVAEDCGQSEDAAGLDGDVIIEDTSANGKSPKKKSYQCPHCVEVFTRKASVRRHVARKHKVMESENSPKNEGHCLCVHCDFTCRGVCDLRKHLSAKHDITFHCQTVTLNNQAGKFIGASREH